MIENNSKLISRLFLIIAVALSSCKSGPFNVFKPSSPHEIYQRKLASAGLDNTAMGKSWINLSNEILLKPVGIKVPYQEKGYFSGQKVQAAAFSFDMVRGQKLQIRLTTRPVENFMIYADIWEREENGELKILGSADTLENSFNSEISKTGTYILRLQPELLSGGEYHLEITSGPSLEYPLKTYQNNQIRSIFGDGRDAGARKHEGIDIFSSFRTPLLAVAPGSVRVNENNLGGKVVWLRPEGKDYTLYYAHLDEQIVQDGQMVKIGDTLGRMGNTGNARTTPPHLHFGIYTRDGAVDPLPFINPAVKDPPEIKSQLGALNSTMRTSGTVTLSTSPSPVSVKMGTIVTVNAASANNYRVELPDGTIGYLAGNKLVSSNNPVAIHKIKAGQQNLYDRPDSAAAVKSNLKTGQTVELLGNFNDYFLVRDQNDETGWIEK